MLNPARAGPFVPLVATHVGVSVPTTDQKVRGSNPFGRTIVTLALTSRNGQG